MRGGENGWGGKGREGVQPLQKKAMMKRKEPCVMRRLSSSLSESALKARNVVQHKPKKKKRKSTFSKVSALLNELDKVAITLTFKNFRQKLL